MVMLLNSLLILDLGIVKLLSKLQIPAGAAFRSYGPNPASWIFLTDTSNATCLPSYSECYFPSRYGLSYMLLLQLQKLMEHGIAGVVIVTL